MDETFIILVLFRHYHYFRYRQVLLSLQRQRQTAEWGADQGEWYWCDYNTDGRSCSAGRMPFWKKDKENGKAKEKVNYKARLEHKQYLVRNYYLSLHWMWRSSCSKATFIFFLSPLFWTMTCYGLRCVQWPCTIGLNERRLNVLTETDRDNPGRSFNQLIERFLIN